MIIAAIDIGTNSTRLMIAEREGVIIRQELYRQSVITRLGQGVNQTGHLSPAAVARTLEVLRDYAELAKDNQAEVVKVVATSAMRDADNVADLLIPAFEILNVVPDIIAGQSEATLTYRGVLSDETTRALGGTFLIIDIGGGSTEIVFGDNQRPVLLDSLPLGCVRLTDAFFSFDPPSPGEITALRLHVRRVIGANFSRVIGVGAVPIAVAGTPTSLALIELKLAAYDRAKVHLYKLTRAGVSRRLGDLASVPLAARQEIVGLEPDRADIIIAGAAILLEIMSFFNFDYVFVSERDILDGIALAAQP